MPLRSARAVLFRAVQFIESRDLAAAETRASPSLTMRAFTSRLSSVSTYANRPRGFSPRPPSCSRRTKAIEGSVPPGNPWPSEQGRLGRPGHEPVWAPRRQAAAPDHRCNADCSAIDDRLNQQASDIKRVTDRYDQKLHIPPDFHGSDRRQHVASAPPATAYRLSERALDWDLSARPARFGPSRPIQLRRLHTTESLHVPVARVRPRTRSEYRLTQLMTPVPGRGPINELSKAANVGATANV